MSQVQNYRASAPYLEQILFALYANNANTAFTTFKSLLVSQTYGPLQTLDSILNADSPYAIKDNSFDWWTGETMAALEAFGVSNLTDLNNYLGLQRDRINYLAREFSEPLVNFLLQINKQGMPGNLPLVTKWEGILNELVGYEQKAPGNGLTSLETYIMGPLHEVTLATCEKYASSVNTISLADDFFVSILINIQEKLYERCRELSGDVSLKNYIDLATFFNANLAGKFPFTEKADSPCLDANPRDIRTYFEMLDAQSANIRTTLTNAQNLGSADQDALNFIDQMDQVRTFFGGYLVPNSTLPTPVFAFQVTFRTNKSRELRANEILNWYLTSQNTTIDMRSKSFEGLWTVGDPMEVRFRWAMNSPLQPLQPLSSQYYRVQGESATFSYTGTWALLRLLRMNQASPSDFSSLNDPMPVTLSFNIPLTNVVSNTCKNQATNPLEAKVFLSLKVMPLNSPVPSATSAASSPNAQPQITPGSPVTLPYFPYTAPVLGQSTGCQKW